MSTWYSGQPPHDKAHWNTYSLSKNDSWKCFDNPKIVNSNNKIFKQHFCKLPGMPIYRYHLFYILEVYFFNLHTKFFLCRYLWDDCLRETQKVFLCYYAAWYVPYHSDPFKNPFEDYMIDLIYPELDLPWCISLWSGVLLFILHQITFFFGIRIEGRNQHSVQVNCDCKFLEESMFFELIFMVVVDRYFKV